MKFYKYTPALLDPKTLEDTLIGRDLELDNLKRILKSAASGKSFSHPILIGPKGIGKSHMLRIIYHAVRGEIKTKGLNAFKDKYIPVIFSEEEYPGNITKFIKLILHYLESETGRIPPISEEISKAGLSHIREKELAFEYIKSFKKKTGKILLLLVDNLNDIIDRFTDEDQSSLRELLMAHDSLLLIGAAPTLFDSIINHDRPLYNFFEIIWLKDLSFEDTVALLTRYAELEDRQDLIKDFIEKEPKLRAIHELAGGNPRLILSLYHIMIEGNIPLIEDAFLKLLDELSPYFRERMKDLSEQQKEIMDVMAKAGTLLTPTEIAGRCHMAVNIVNSQLKRLEKIGYIHIAKKHPKKVLYDLKERLFSLWRQMRVEAGRKRLGFIVRFLEIWFTEEELFTYLDKTLATIHEKMPLDHIELQHDMDTLWYLKEAIPEFRGDDEVCVTCEREKYDVALELINKALSKKPDDAFKLYQRGCIYGKRKQYGKAIESFKISLELKPEKYLAWLKLGDAYAFHKEFEHAIEAYKKSVELKADNHRAWNNLGNTYANLKRYEEALETYKKALKIKPDEQMTLNNLGRVYRELKRYDEALESYKKALEIQPGAWQSWGRLADLLFDLKKYQNAIEASKKSLEIKPDDNPAWNILGSSHLALKQWSDALRNYKEGISKIKSCKHCKEVARLGLGITHIYHFIDSGIANDIESSIESLKESLNCLPLLQEKDKFIDGFMEAFKKIIRANKIDLIKSALNAIEEAKQDELLTILSPYSTLIKYLETKDFEVIDRLRHEERIVIDDMLKMLGEKVVEKPIKIKRKKTKMLVH